jgi:hypothetical protein
VPATPLTACGGDPVGRWDGDTQRREGYSLTLFPPAGSGTCPAEIVSASEAICTLELVAGGSGQLDCSGQVTEMKVASACIESLGSHCTDLRSVSCAAPVCGACRCTEGVEAFSEPVLWSTTETQFTLQVGSGAPLVLDYCVNGNALELGTAAGGIRWLFTRP